MVEHKVEVLQVRKLNGICCFTQRRTYRVQRRSLTRTKNHTNNSLTYEENTRQKYNDNLCLFRAVALHLHVNQRLEEETSKWFNLFINKVDGLNANPFRGNHLKDIPTVEELLTPNMLLYDIEIVHSNFFGELVRRSEQKYESTMRLLLYNNLICYVNNIKAVFESFRCPNCDTFFNRNINLERHLTTCSEQVKMSIRRTIYQTKKTLFYKLDFFWNSIN